MEGIAKTVEIFSYNGLYGLELRMVLNRNCLRNWKTIFRTRSIDQTISRENAFFKLGVQKIERAIRYVALSSYWGQKYSVISKL